MDIAVGDRTETVSVDRLKPHTAKKEAQAETHPRREADLWASPVGPAAQCPERLGGGALWRPAREAGKSPTI